MSNNCRTVGDLVAYLRNLPVDMQVCATVHGLGADHPLQVLTFVIEPQENRATLVFVNPYLQTMRN